MLDSDYVWAIAQRGQVYRLMGNYQKALADFNQAVALDSNYRWAIRRRGEVYGLMRQYEKALADLNYSLEVNPSSNWTLYWRAIVYRAVNRKEEAEDDLYEAVQIAQLSYERDPTDLRNILNLALYHVTAGDIKTGNSFYQEVLSSKYASHYLPKAKRDLEEFQSLFPNHRSAKVGLKVFAKKVIENISTLKSTLT